LLAGHSMSDDADTAASGVDAPAFAAAEAPLPPTSFGARLKWEREQAGLSVTDVAARLRLHPNQIRAIEQESLAALPEPAYVRGFVRSYARIVNADPVPLLDDLSTKIVPAERSVVDGMAQPRDYSPVRAAAREQASRRFVVLGAVLVLIVLGALGWYATQQKAQMPAAATTAPAAVPSVVTPPPTAQSAVATSVENAVPAAAGSAGPASESAAVMEPVAPAPLLKLRFTGPSWAEVKDAEGKVLHSQHNSPGSEFIIEGTPPFYVVIGDATKTTVEVRGEVFDMAPHTKQYVARFTIN
jgi:cytoskeleton protein RodZ